MNDGERIRRDLAAIDPEDEASVSDLRAVLMSYKGKCGPVECAACENEFVCRCMDIVGYLECNLKDPICSRCLYDADPLLHSLYKISNDVVELIQLRHTIAKLPNDLQQPGKEIH